MALLREEWCIVGTFEAFFFSFLSPIFFLGSSAILGAPLPPSESMCINTCNYTLLIRHFCWQRRRRLPEVLEVCGAREHWLASKNHACVFVKKGPVSHPEGEFKLISTHHLQGYFRIFFRLKQLCLEPPSWEEEKMPGSWSPWFSQPLFPQA